MIYPVLTTCSGVGYTAPAWQVLFHVADKVIGILVLTGKVDERLKRLIDS